MGRICLEFLGSHTNDRARWVPRGPWDDPLSSVPLETLNYGNYLSKNK